MSNDLYIFLAILIMMAGTFFLRGSAFVIFKNKTPKIILYLGKVLPSAAMAMLVVYCFKSVDVTTGNHGIPELIATLVVVALHKWKHNTLLSILVGTILYMGLLQLVFV